MRGQFLQPSNQRNASETRNSPSLGEALSVERLKACEMLTALRSATARECLAFEVFAAWIESWGALWEDAIQTRNLMQRLLGCLAGWIETTPKTLPVGKLLVLAPAALITNFDIFYVSGPRLATISLDWKCLWETIILNVLSWVSHKIFTSTCFSKCDALIRDVWVLTNKFQRKLVSILLITGVPGNIKSSRRVCAKFTRFVWSFENWRGNVC